MINRMVKDHEEIKIMKPGRIVKQGFMVLFACLVTGIFVTTAFGEVGQTLSQVTQAHGTPQSVALSHALPRAKAAAYEKKGVRAYTFQVNRFKIYAVFNASGVCYEEFTRHNRMLPKASTLIGQSLANEKPKVLMIIPLRMERYQYGTGSNAVIYETFGTPGNLSVRAYSPSLAPGLP